MQFYEAKLYCVLVIIVNKHMSWVDLSWGQDALEDSEEGSVLKGTTERETRTTQVWGSRKEITHLLLLYDEYIDSENNNGEPRAYWLEEDETL
jgi:hypothetical protein